MYVCIKSSVTRLVYNVLLTLSHTQTAIPVPSPVSGVIEELFVPDGDKVTAGSQLCKINTSSTTQAAAAEAPPTQQPSAAAKGGAGPPTATPPPQAEATPTPTPTSPPPPPPLPG